MIRIIKTLIVLSVSGSVFSDNTSPVGTWRSIDDKTGEPKSIIEIKDNNGYLEGRVLTLLNHSEPNPLCEKCSGERANQAVIGMTILWGVTKQKQGGWGKGKILDPENGHVYSVNLQPIEEGNRLKVRGYLGTPLLGRTQRWERIAF